MLLTTPMCVVASVLASDDIRPGSDRPDSRETRTNAPTSLGGWFRNMGVTVVQLTGSLDRTPRFT